MSATLVWATVMCLAGALQAAPFEASSPREALRGFLSPNMPSGPDVRPLPREGKWWPTQVAPRRRPLRPGSWLRRGHQAVDRRQEELLSTVERLPGDREAEVVKRALSLWVTLHPLTPVPTSGRPPVSHEHPAASSSVRRPYGQRLRWGR